MHKFKTHIFLLFVAFYIKNFALCHQNPSFPNTNMPSNHLHNNKQSQNFGGEQVKDEKHIKEHLEGKVDITANMTPEQLQFHYFKVHDTNKDGKLDGIEIYKAITHFHLANADSISTSQHQDKMPPLPTTNELKTMIDSILAQDDYNKDGGIDYMEFSLAQRQREEQAHANQQQQQ